MKKILMFMIIGLSITFVLSGCGGSGGTTPPTNDGITVTSVEIK